MSSMKSIIAVSLLALLLSGCAGEYYPINDETIQKGGEYTRDASVAKEEAVHKTLRNRDNKIKESHAASGMKLTWQAMPETVFYPGMTAPITINRYLPVVEYREQARFEQKLPTEPSVHPMWASLTSLGNNLIDKTFFGFLGSEMFGTLNKAIDNAGTRYNGPYNPQNYDNSFNATAEPFIVEPMVITQ